MKRLILLLMLPVAMLSSCGRQTVLEDTDPRVKELLNEMTLDEKIGQMVLFTSDWDVTGPTIHEG